MRYFLILVIISFFSFCKATKLPFGLNYSFDILQDTSRSNQYLRSGLRKFEAKSYEAALLDFDAAVYNSQSNWKAYRFRGDVYMELKKYESAILDYSQSLSLNGKDTLSFKGRADAKRFTGDLKGALEDYNIAIEWDPKDPGMHLGRAECYFGLRLYKQAIEDYDLPIKSIGKLSNVVFYRRGYSYLEGGHYKDAITDFTRYLSFGGDAAIIYYYRGFSYFQINSENILYADSAILDLKKYEVSTKLSNLELSRVHKILGGAYAAKNDSLKARENFRQSLTIKPSDQNTFFLWGSAELNFHNYSKAIELLEEVERQTPDIDAGLYYRLGVAKAGVRDTTMSLRDYEKALKLDSTMDEVYAARLKLIYGSSKYNKFILQDLGHLIRRSNETERISLFYAARSIVNHRMQNNTEAKSDVDKAIAMSPSEPIYYIIRSVVRNNRDKALILADYDKAIHLNNTLMEAYLMKSYFYREQGEEKKACTNLTKAEKLGTKVPRGVRDYVCGGGPLRRMKDSALQFVIYPYLKEAIVNPKLKK